MKLNNKSHPVWVCGLELVRSLQSAIGHVVTPCMGVWIETAEARKVEEEAESHPVWVCGLKLIFTLLSELNHLSHPVWVCGLKHVEEASLSFAYPSHTLYGCVD